LDPKAGTIVMRRSVCALPRGLAYDASADRLLVACAGGELLTFTTTGSTAERSLKLQPDLRDVVVDGSRVMVSRFRSAQVIVLDSAGTVVETMAPASFTSTQVHNGSTFGPAVAWRMVSKPGGGAVMVHQRGLDDVVGDSPGGYGGLSPCDTIVHTSVTKMKAGERPLAGPAMPGFVLPVDIAVSGDGTRVAMVAAGNGHAPSGARRLFVAKVDDVAGEWPDSACTQDDVHSPSPAPNCPRSTRILVFPADASGSCPMGFNFCGGMCWDPTITPPNFCSPSMTMAGGAGGSSGSGGGVGSGAPNGTSGGNGAGAMSLGVGNSGDVGGVAGAGGVAGSDQAGAMGGAAGSGGAIAPGIGGFGGAPVSCSLGLVELPSGAHQPR
jgi:hypothetical protein